LLIEAYLFQTLGTDVARIVEAPLGSLLIGFAAYNLVITVLVIFRRSWPVTLAYVTATIDTIGSILFVAAVPDDLMNPRLIGVAAAGVGDGIRRFPLLDTFAYSFLIGIGTVVVHYLYTGRLLLELPDTIVLGSLALLPLLVRAATLAPNEGGRDDPMGRLHGRGLAAATSLPAGSSHDATDLFHAAAGALAGYSDSALGAVLVRGDDDGLDLYTMVDKRPIVDRLPEQPVEQLPGRLLALTEPALLARRDDLNTRGLPDQFPNRLDRIIAVPIPNVSNRGAVLFAANRRGDYRPDDRALAILLGSEISRIYLSNSMAISAAEARLASTEALLAAIESKRPGSREQAEESARIAAAIARQLGWTEAAIDDLKIAALMHDIGELAVPDPVLDKPMPLAPDEFEIMKNHPRIASRIIDYFNKSPIVLNAVYTHHERWDGRGYPQGLAGETIPLEGRIMCLADSIESMLSPKVFRPALTTTEALQEVIKGSGTQFDPSVVQSFLAVLREQGQDFLERAPSHDTPVPAAHDWNRATEL